MKFSFLKNTRFKTHKAFFLGDGSFGYLDILDMLIFLFVVLVMRV